jgi:hypothetical protein
MEDGGVSDAVAVPVKEPSWSFDPQDWLDSVRERWAGATGQVTGVADRPTAAYAVLPGDPYPLEVALYRDLCTVAFEPVLAGAIAEFVVWWVTRLPACGPPAHLFVGGDADRSLPLTAGLTADQVRRFIDPGPPA